MTLEFLAKLKSAALAAGILTITSAGADDWPQYRGPNHDGKSGEKILKQWPQNGPRLVWKTPTPNGFSSFAVAGGKVFTIMGRDVEGALREVLVAFDAETGKEDWAQSIGVALYGHDGGNQGKTDNKGGDGPRSTPTVDGGRVYAMNADLVLHCLDAGKGTQIWSKDLIKDHDGKNITWKNAASPLIDGNLLFVGGGGVGQAFLGIDKTDGRVVWKAHDDKITHATPVPATIAGVRQIIFFTQKGLLSLAPDSGKELWRYSFRFNVSTAASPLVAGDIVYCSAGYGVGAAAVKIAKTGDAFTATELWRKTGDKPVVNHWSTPVYHKGYLYGMFSFKEYGDGPLKCIQLASGQEMWAKEGFGAGNVLLVDGHILALGDAGQLVLIEADQKEYKEVARVDVIDGKCWSSPAVSNGRIFARSTKEGVCLDVSVKSAAK